VKNLISHVHFFNVRAHFHIKKWGGEEVRSATEARGKKIPSSRATSRVTTSARRANAFAGKMKAGAVATAWARAQAKVTVREKI